MHKAILVATQGAVVSVDCTPSASRLVAGTVGRRVYLLDRSGEPLLPPIDTDDEVWAVSIDGMGDVFAVGTASKRPSQGSIHCYNATGHTLFTARYRAPVWGVSLSPSGQFLAATTWAGHLYLYRRDVGSFKPFWRTQSSVCQFGLYGVRVDDRGNALAAAYDTGLFLFDGSNQTASLIPLRTGLYNVSRPTAHGAAFVGRRGGDVCRITIGNGRGGSRSRKPSLSFLPGFSARPVCGVASSPHEEVILTGSFDGVIRAVSSTGALLWDYPTMGEAWSVALSEDMRFAVAGSGDGHIYIIETDCGSGDVAELTRCETALNAGSISAFSTYVAVSIRVRAFARASDFVETLVARGQLSKASAGILAAAIESASPEARHAFLAGKLYRVAGELAAAVGSLQAAAYDPAMQSRALALAASCFRDMGMVAAAQALHHRATLTRPDQDGLRLHYDLARSYEVRGALSQARQHYEFLASWDIRYRDSITRFEIVRDSELPHLEAKARNLDYTGPTVNMLGPDVPRAAEVDESLYEVLKAHDQESILGPGERRRSLESVRFLARHHVFKPVEPREFGYDVATYTRYEQSQPEDAAKKHLEMVNLAAEVSLQSVHRSLDIGTATCRYPTFLQRLGIDAFGLDVDRNGYDLVRKALDARGTPFRRFIQANGLAIPTRSDAFDLVTCMMGTTNHISKPACRDLFLEAFRVTMSGGSFVASVWDCSCPFQSFLTIYGTDTKELLRKVELVPEALRDLAYDVNFDLVKIVRFACFPDRLIYDLGFNHVSRYDIERLLEVDLAVRNRQLIAQSQMALVVCTKR